MAQLISATYYNDTREWVYVTDNFCRIVHDTRTGEWTLHRIPCPNDLLDVHYGMPSAEDIAKLTAPVRYVPPVKVDVPPYHSAEVAVDD